MIRSTTDFEILVITPAGLAEPSLAIAASRAGAIGVLNLEFSGDRAASMAAIEKLAASARGPFGVLLPGGEADLLASVLDRGGPNLTLVLVSIAPAARLAEIAGSIRSAGKRAYLVATDLDAARLGQAAGFDAILAKGHEAGGWVGEETSFVLLQRLIPNLDIPVLVQGGVGLHTAGACFAAGAAGVALDSQLLLTKESPLPDAVKARIASMDGSETACFGSSYRAPFRSYSRPNLAGVEAIRKLEIPVEGESRAIEVVREVWRAEVSRRVDWRDASSGVLAIGQDAAFAAGFAKRFGTVGGVVAGLKESIRKHCEGARSINPIASGSPLAESHGTKYPIVQGPMTRVSDRAEFALAVADGGGLPFLALALMRAKEIEILLRETHALLGDRPWGVGLLGFVPQALRDEQLAVVRSCPPPHAIIAGGRPEQAKGLEADGIKTYLHVPSPGLLKMFLQEGSARFIFEGRECGGHIGPRTSFVLWESMVDVILDHLGTSGDGSKYHILFAGGVHDGLSGAMVATLASPLSERGVKVGVLIGTAYLFTEEAVESGAIVRKFQEAAVACEETAVLESGPGNVTRCAPSPFVTSFAEEKHRLQRSGLSAEELKNELEVLNIGRLRVASKGVDRNPDYKKQPDAPKFVDVDAEGQWSQGMYMIGQVAALRDGVCTIKGLHDEISAGSTARLAAMADPVRASEPPPKTAAIAIVGMGTILPGAPDLQTYWANILNKIDAITEVPASRWNWRDYFDPDRSAKDKVYSRWGGFVDDIPFDPVTYGIPPGNLKSIEPFQLMALAVVRAALTDAGYLDRPFPRDRTSVILGAGGGGADLTAGYMVRSSLPHLLGEASGTDLTENLGTNLPEWTEDSFAGILMNVAAGRVANRFDLGGVNYTVDAACASSLAAVYLAVRDLEARTSDVVIVGGVDAIQNPFAFLCFSKTQALSPTGRCRTFDEQGDGIAISEGFAALVLKRLDDAERDGDRIYGVIRGAGGSSDGRDRSLTAPRPEGQARALERAYAQSNFPPATVGLIEAHGTGTVAGDMAEVRALTQFFGKTGAETQGCAIGSVKSMIGHAKAAAGVAGLIKATLALHHRVLPPTLGVTRPNPKAKFHESPFYVNSEARPWVARADGLPRRAGVSAFGFGGTNFHISVEEYTGDFLPRTEAIVDNWPAELFLWRGVSKAEVLKPVTGLLAQLEKGLKPRLTDLALSTCRVAGLASPGKKTLAIVATSIDDLVEKLKQAKALLEGKDARRHGPGGLHYSESPLAESGKVAFLFPGQGSQYVNMGRDLALLFPEARAGFETADRVLDGRLGRPLSRFVFPPPAFEDDGVRRQKAELTETDVAQAALGATELAYLNLLRSMGVEPGMTAGHSYGEFVALHAAGCLDAESLLVVSEARGRFIREGTTEDSGTMAAVDAGFDALKPLVGEPGLTLANLNAPSQTVVSGTASAVDKAIAWCSSKGIQARKIAVACAFHSPLVAPAQKKLAELLGTIAIDSPKVPVFSNTTALAHSSDPSTIAALLGEHLVRPVEFVRQVNAMYEAGARIFVEVGPGRVLSGLVGRILGDKPHASLPLDQPGRPGLAAFLDGLAAMAAEGVEVNVARLFQGRSARLLDLSRLEKDSAKPAPSPTTWLINGGSARPIRENGGAIKPRQEPPRIKVLTNGESSKESNAAVIDQPRKPLPLAVAEIPALPVPKNGHASSPSPSPSLSSGISNGDRGVAARPGVQPRGIHPPRAEEPKVVTQTASPETRMAMPRPLPAPPRPLAASETAFRPGSPTLPPDIIRQFQQVMQQFLTTQQATMQNLLHAFYGQGGAIPMAPASYETTNGASQSPLPYAAAPHHVVAEPEHAYPATNGGYHEPAPVHYPTTNGGSIRPGLAGVALPLPMELARASAAPAPIPTPVHHAPAPAPMPAPAPAPAPVAVVVPAAPVAMPISAPVAASSLPTREELTARLLDIVSERTGYPTEMLALDVDLEADLGIDSIKRVEVAGTIVRSLDWPASGPPDPERLTSSRTLRQVVDTLAEMLGLDGGETASPALVGALAGEENGHPFDGGRGTTGIARYEPEPVVAPPITTLGELSKAGVVVIVDDEAGVGDRLAALLANRGHRVVRVVSGPAIKGGVGELLVADLAKPEDVTRLVDSIHSKHGAATALINLSALRSGAETIGADIPSWKARLAVDLRGLFTLSQALRIDLEKAAGEGGAVVLGATALGGAFGVDGFGPSFFPGQGAVTGFLKTLAQEWPSVRVKAVDLDPVEPEIIAGYLMDELHAADGLVEVGYRDGERTTLRLVPVPLEPKKDEIRLDRDSVVLITGGARGITAEVAIRLAEAYQPTLLLVGRTPPPAQPEGPETLGLTDPKLLRQAIIAGYKARAIVPKPIAVEDDYRRLIREREVRETLDRIVRSGAKVESISCDVRDAAALTACVEHAYRAYGRIDGVIHGAGVIEDKLVKDKALDSFDRVVETKVHGALALAGSLRAESLKFLVFFSSISGRFGNRGQGDYAAANEILNKLAQDLDRRWSGRVVAINWGPWQTAGMASPEVLKQFAERGVSLIGVEDGCRRLIDELRFGVKGDVEVLIGGAMSPAVAGSQAPSAASETSGQAPKEAVRPLPMLAKATCRPKTDGVFEVDRTFDLGHDLYLDDHRIDDKPVLPFAVAMELMAEVASAAKPGSRFLGLRNIRLMRGVSLEGDRPMTLKVIARPSAGETLDLTIVSTENPPRMHYRSTARLADAQGQGIEAEDASPPRVSPLGEAGQLPMSLANAYREWLFHGPIFQGIISVDAIGPNGSSAVLRTSIPGDCLAGDASGSWLVDPVLIDCAFQVQLFWARQHWDITLLPSLLKDFRRVAPVGYLPRGGAREIRHEMRIGPANQAPICQADHFFFDPDGRLLATLSGSEAVGSKALNRLAEASRR